MVDVDAVLRSILVDELGVAPARAAALTDASGLFGDMPEFDSMAVANVLESIENRLGFLVDDDYVDADMFATFGALRDYCAGRVAD